MNERSRSRRSAASGEYESIEAERHDVDAQLERLVQRDALAGLLLDLMPVVAKGKVSVPRAVVARADVRESFLALDLDSQRAVLRALTSSITVAQATKGIRHTKETAAERVRITPAD